MFLLDTNHCSGIILENPQILARLSSLGETPISTCTIVMGELIDMAARSRRRQENLARVRRFTDRLYIYPIDTDTAEIYGDLKAGFFDRYAPKDRKQRRRTTIEQLGISDNDLWIASVVIQHQLILVTGDRDFQRLQPVRSLHGSQSYCVAGFAVARTLRNRAIAIYTSPGSIPSERSLAANRSFSASARSARWRSLSFSARSQSLCAAV